MENECRQAMNLLDSYGAPKDRYLELIHEFPLRPIRTNSELSSAIRRLCRLHDQQRPDEAEEDYCEALGELIDRYQKSRREKPEITDAEMLRFLLESRDLTQTKFAVAIGIAETTISEVLASKRHFTHDQIGKVADYLQVLPTVFPSGSE
jgi:HTH-type transcriptional regulator / antitoxin HigA